MQAFIQTQDNRPFSLVAMIAAEGFRQRGYELIPFKVEDIDTTLWSLESPIVGGVGTIKRALYILNVPYAHDTYPLDLRHFLKRNVSERTLGSIRSSELPLFIKPRVDDKKFTGFVCADIFDRHLGNLPNNLPIYASDPIEILTEYRCYILNGKILSVARYTGPVDYFPNMKTVRGMIYSYLNAPIAYSIDVGTTPDEDTVLIEVNDAMSLGNYGLPPTLAAKMIAARWFQLTGQDYKDEADCYDSPAFISH